MRRPFSNNRPFGPFVAQSGDYIDEGERDLTPFAFVRAFEQRYQDGQESGRISEMGIGSLEWSRSGSFIQLEYGFHETAIERKFEFTPHDINVGSTRAQGTNLKQLGGNAAKVAKIIDRVYDEAEEFDFSQLSAASIGHTHFTSYEFKYEASLVHSEVMDTDIGEKM